MIKKIITNIKSILLKRSVKVIVWDFDGTLYKSKRLIEAYEKEYFDYTKSKSNNKSLTIAEFRKLVRDHGSWMNASSFVTNIRDIEIANYVDRRVKKANYIKHNKGMVNLICNIKNCQHVILSNASKKDIIDGLKKIGFIKSKDGFLPFKAILSRENHVEKPKIFSFKQVQKITKLPPQKHLMIGDSIREDIEPAKKIGFQALHIDEAEIILQKWTR